MPRLSCKRQRIINARRMHNYLQRARKLAALQSNSESAIDEDKEEWLSCQVDVNKLVQRNGSAVSFESDEEWPEGPSGSVDTTDQKEIEPTQPYEIIDEEFKLKEETAETDSVVEDSDTLPNIPSESPPPGNCVNPPLQQSEEWVIEQQLCRCCHAEGDNFLSLQDMEQLEGVSYEEMLATCFDIRLLEADAHALRTLCTLCAVRLREAHAFRREVRAFELHFQTLHNNNLIRVAGAATLGKEEIEEIDEPPEADDVDGDLIQDEIELQSEEPKKPKRSKDPDSKPRAPRKKYLPLSAYAQGYEREGPNYKCTKCDKICVTIKHYCQHNKKVHMKKEKKPLCLKCRVRFETIDLKKAHIREVHRTINKYKCNACEKCFNQYKTLSHHIRVYHKLGSIKKCDICDYESYDGRLLRKHMVRHTGTKDFKCSYCEKSFLRPATLRLHEMIHTGEKRKKCEECGKAFVQKASLNYHMAKYHPEVRF